MKQVNMWLDDDVHALLVRMAAEEQLETGKWVPISRLASRIVKETLNGHKPDNEQTPANDAKQDAEQPAKNPFADINF